MLTKSQELFLLSMKWPWNYRKQFTNHLVLTSPMEYVSRGILRYHVNTYRALASLNETKVAMEIR